MHPTSIDLADVKLKIRIPIDLNGWRQYAAIHTGHKGYVIYWTDEIGLTWYWTTARYWVDQDTWENGDGPKDEIFFETRDKANYALTKAKVPPTYLGFIR